MPDDDFDDLDDETEEWGEDDRVTLTDPPLGRKYKPYDEPHSRKPKGLLTVPWDPCPQCARYGERKGYQPNSYGAVDYHCPQCLGVGFLDVPLDDGSLLSATPGSDSRVIMLAARNAHGIYPVMPDTAYRVAVDGGTFLKP